MAGQHWGERNDKPSRLENTLVGILSTIAAVLVYGGLALMVLALLRA
jgi:hypothetical protein